MTLTNIFCIGFVLLQLYNVGNCHSWLGCADYQAELSPTTQDFGYANCKGYIRGHKDAFASDSFDRGNQDKFNRGSVGCQHVITSPIYDAYDDAHPHANYTPGSTYRLVWPAKNHAIGEECGSTNSVDKEMKIYVNPQVNPTVDLTDISDYTLVYDWHAESGEDFSSGRGIEGIPFANCMDFCSNTDASPCFGDLPIADGIFTQSGYYTFLWYWQFSELIVSCFDVYIDLGGDVVNVVTPSPANSPTDPPTNNNNNNGGGNNNVETTSANNNNNNNNNGGNNNGGGGSTIETTGSNAAINLVTEIATVWDVKAPMCFDGAEYDGDLIVNTFENLFNTDWAIIQFSKHFNQDKFNFTGETQTTDIVQVSLMLDNGTACARLVEEFGGTGTCSICNGGTIKSDSGETAVVVVSGNNNNNNNDADTDYGLSKYNVNSVTLVVFGSIINILMVLFAI